MLFLSPAELTALQSNPLPLAVLVEMYLAEGPLFLNTSSLDLTIGGSVYYGTKGLGKIGAVQETPAEIKQLTFELSGAPATQVAFALTEQVQGRTVNIKLAIFDPSTYQVLGAHLKWSGYLDALTITDSPSAATITVTAEHAGIDLIRPSGSLYSDAEQERLYPGDPSLQYLVDQVDLRVVWPAAAYFDK